jgi:hypothetical protein
MRKLLIGALAAIAFAQTMAYFVYLRDDPGNYNSAGAQGDQVTYIALAQEVAQGRWEGAVHYMPGLPAAIAASQTLVGDPRLGIAVLQGLIYAVLVLGVARLAGAVYGEHTAVWSAAAVGLNPALGFYAAQALTEFLTGALLVAVVAAIVAWAARPRWSLMVLSGVLIGATGYLRSEYLGLAIVFALVVVVLERTRVGVLSAGLLIAVTVLTMVPWVARYAVVTGRPSLYNESPISNLILMGTWFRVFDEQTFSELQRIETSALSRDDARAEASRVGPRPDLSVRYMEQARGPYERPLDETLALAADNVRLNLRQYAINHGVLAPVLIWAGHTPVRAADTPRLPSSARYVIWGAELALLLLAIWQALLGLRGERTQALSLSVLGVIAFLTAVHILIAVDSRFTTPALPLVGLMAGVRIAQLLQGRQPLAVRYAG